MSLYRLHKPSVDKVLEIIKKYRREYEETGGSETIYAIDGIRALIHQDEGIRAKLLCQKEYHSKENRLLYNSMQALCRNGTSEDSKRIIRSLRTNLFGERR